MSNKERLGKNPLFRDALKPKEQAGETTTEESKLSKPSKLTSKAGLKEGWTRGAFVMREQTIETIKSYAYWERREIKDVVEEIFNSFFHGRDVQPRPDKR